MRTWFLLLSLAVIGASTTGCASEQGSSGEELLSSADIDEYQPGTPERLVLEWWRQVQFNNAVSALAFYSREAKPDRQELNRQLGEAAGFFNGIPEIGDVRTPSKGEATVLLTIDRGDRVRAAALNLVQEGGEWKLADNLLVEQAVATARRSSGVPADEPEAGAR